MMGQSLGCEVSEGWDGKGRQGGRANIGGRGWGEGLERRRGKKKLLGHKACGEGVGQGVFPVWQALPHLFMIGVCRVMPLLILIGSVLDGHKMCQPLNIQNHTKGKVIRVPMKGFFAWAFFLLFFWQSLAGADLFPLQCEKRKKKKKH